MQLDYSIKHQVHISMYNFLDEIIADFERIEPNNSGTKTLAAPSNLFKVNKDCEKVSKAQ